MIQKFVYIIVDGKLTVNLKDIIIQKNKEMKNTKFVLEKNCSDINEAYRKYLKIKIINV